MRVGLIILSLLCQLSVPEQKAPREDPIKSTIRNRQKRSTKRAYAVRDRRSAAERHAEASAKTAEALRARQMENDRHTAIMMNAANGQAANAIQAERNRVMLEQAKAMNRMAGVPVCTNCGALGHYACAVLRKSPAVLEYEAALGGMIPH